MVFYLFQSLAYRVYVGVYVAGVMYTTYTNKCLSGVCWCISGVCSAEQCTPVFQLRIMSLQAWCMLCMLVRCKVFLNKKILHQDQGEMGNAG